MTKKLLFHFQEKNLNRQKKLTKGRGNGIVILIYCYLFGQRYCVKVSLLLKKVHYFYSYLLFEKGRGTCLTWRPKVNLLLNPGS